MSNSATTSPGARDDFVVAAKWTAIVAAAMCIFIITMLSLHMIQDRRTTPLNSPEIAALKAQLAERPNDEAFKDSIRKRDLQLRDGYFRRIQLSGRGGWLLVSAGAALVIALKSYGTLSRRWELPGTNRADTWQQNRMARWGVVGSAGLLVLTVVAWVAFATPALPEPKLPEPIVLTPATPERLAANWVSFRGYRGDGFVKGPMPDKWDGGSREGILWKARIPLPGHSSAIVFDRSVFVTGSDGNSQEIYCFDAVSGKRKWRSSVPRGTQQKPNAFEDTGFAASTPVTDGARVCAIFAGGDIAAFDYAGRRLWSKAIATPESTYGYASSLALCGEKVIVQWDQGTEAADGKSALIALDIATGKEAWKTPRPVGGAWASPVVADDRIYTAGQPWVMCYNAADGKEIWRAKLFENADVAPSPLWHDQVLYLGNDRALAAAIRTDGSGDVTSSHVKWSVTEVTLPDMVSPVTDGRRVLYTHGGGDLTCVDAQTGKTLWTHSLEHTVRSSPVLAGSTVYLFDVDGTAYVFDLADQFQEKGSFPLGEQVTASPAVVGGRIYIRAKDNLYCIGHQ